MGLASVIAVAMWSNAAFAIPPALPEDAKRYAEAEKQKQEMATDLQSPEARALVELFFERTSEGEAFDIKEIFTEGAFYVRADGERERIAENLNDDGSLGIPQWELISLFRLSDCWAAAVDIRLHPVGLSEAVLKFSFYRESSGTLKIVSIEEVRL